MKITVCGAAGGEVTGSSYLIETARAKVLVDCGMFQGHGQADDESNQNLGPVNPPQLTAVVLTHAHLDHCGRLPLLCKRGLDCPIFATPATTDFAQLIMEDSAKLHEADTARENRYRRIEEKPLLEPLYGREDVDKVMPHMKSIAYDSVREIAPGITVRFVDAGHILGSASVDMRIIEGNVTRRIIFSADIGRWNVPFLNDPKPLSGAADLVFLESTYGDREHRSQADTITEFRSVIQEAVWNRQKILIPAFAIGRTQHVLYYLAELMRDQSVPEFPIYLDSPMAIKATELYKKHHSYFDAEAASLNQRGTLSHDLRNLHYLESPEESRSLNERDECCVIIAGGGMCEGGRIVHHIKHNIWKRGVHVVMVGYASKGSLGRKLIDGAKEIYLHRLRIPVRATINTLGGFSAHAGQSELLKWLEPLAQHSPRVCLTHGEDPQRQKLAEAIEKRFGMVPMLPAKFETIEL